MKKMFRLLENVNNVNTFYQVDSFEHVNGNQQDIYFQLEQVWSGDCPDGHVERYVPSVSATIQVTFDSLDSALVISRPATMAFSADDRSIWKVTLLAGDIINGNMSLVLTDGGINETLLLDGRLVASSAGTSRFYC